MQITWRLFIKVNYEIKLRMFARCTTLKYLHVFKTSTSAVLFLMGILQFCKSKDKRSISHLISIFNTFKISQIHQLPHAELTVKLLPTSENLVNACRGSLSILNTEAHWRFEFDDTVPRSIGAHNYTLLFQPEQIKMDSCYQVIVASWERTEMVSTFVQDVLLLLLLVFWTLCL